MQLLENITKIAKTQYGKNVRFIKCKNFFNYFHDMNEFYTLNFQTEDITKSVHKVFSY